MLVGDRAGLVRPDVWCTYLQQATKDLGSEPIVLMLDKHPTGGEHHTTTRTYPATWQDSTNSPAWQDSTTAPRLAG